MLTIVSDLLLTDAFLIKGQIENKYTRLSQLLDEYRKYFIEVRDATLIDLNSRDRIHTPLLHVNLDEVLLAHELIETAGDPHAAQSARRIPTCSAGPTRSLARAHVAAEPAYRPPAEV